MCYKSITLSSIERGKRPVTFYCRFSVHSDRIFYSVEVYGASERNSVRISKAVMLEPDQESHENENKVEPSYAVSHFRVSHSGSYIKEERSPIASILPHCKRLRLLKAKYSLGRAC